MILWEAHVPLMMPVTAVSVGVYVRYILDASLSKCLICRKVTAIANYTQRVNDITLDATQHTQALYFIDHVSLRHQ